MVSVVVSNVIFFNIASTVIFFNIASTRTGSPTGAFVVSDKIRVIEVEHDSC